MDTRPVVDFSDEACQAFDLPGGSHGILLIHGFTGSAAHMRPLGEELHEQGFTVVGINLPGHAQSIDAMALTHWQDWLTAAKEAAYALGQRCEHISVAGLSMGGVLALLLAEQMSITAVAPISAPMAVQNKLMAFARPASLLVKNTYWRSNPQRAAMLDSRYDYGYAGFPTRCAADLNHLIRLARRDLHAVTCPVLAVQSHGDETVSADSADVIVSGVSSRRKGVLWLEDVPHVCTITRACGTIAAAIAEHFHDAET